MKSLNGLAGSLQLATGNNVTITQPDRRTIRVSAQSGLTSVRHDGSLKGAGTSTDLLGLRIPLLLDGGQLDGRPLVDLVASQTGSNRFKIAGGKPGLEVSWQVTGIRRDAYANRHRILVEQDKPEHERGRYLHPEVRRPADRSQDCRDADSTACREP